MKLALITLLISIGSLSAQTLGITPTPVKIPNPPAAPAPPPTPTQTNPVFHVDSFSVLSLTINSGAATVSLAQTPLPAYGAFVFFTSSQLDGNITIPVLNPQPSFIFTLPTTYAFTSLDIIQVAYWAAQ